MKKIGSFLGCFLPIIVALLCQVVVSIGFSVVYGAYLGVKMVMLGISDMEAQQVYLAESMNNPDMILAITAIATLCTLVVGALWYHGYKPKKDFTWKEVINPKLLAAMFGLGLALQLLISMCLNAIYPLLPQSMIDQYGELMETLLDGNALLSLLATVILAPLAEELLFRGVTMKMAQKIMPFMVANLLQAVLFGIYHLNLIQGVYAFVLGIILGFTAEYFHSIWASILLHAFVNGSAELLNLVPESVTETYIGVVGIAVVGVVLLFAAAKLYPQARTERPEEKIEENKMFSENSFDE